MPLPLRPLPAAALLAALVAGLAAGCAEPPPFPPRSNILLVTVDTLRADHLSAYGYPRPTSPSLDALAADGVRFDQTMVQWPKTGPSFASMFTATYPKDNEIVRQVGIPLPFEFRMLAEELAARGYQTGAVVANGAVAADFHFDQGFDRYLETWKLFPRDGEIDFTGAEAVNRLARELFDGFDPDRPFFAWVHYLDPHTPYAPPGEWADRFVGDERYDPSVKIRIERESHQKQMTGIGRSQVLDGREELAFYVARYDAEIAYADAEIGELLDHLGERGHLERTLTVVTSDHGESLGEHHYYFDHGRFAFQTCARVPLLFHYPGVLEPRVDPRPVELLHLAPTLLEVAGVDLPEGVWMQGRSLVPRLLGEAPPPAQGPLAYGEAGYATGGQWQRVVRDERFKLIFAPNRSENRWIGGVDVPYALYDLVADPGETVNVADEHPVELARLQGALVAWLEAEPFPVLVDAAGGEVAGEEGMEEGTREQLKALGYID